MDELLPELCHGGPLTSTELNCHTLFLQPFWPARNSSNMSGLVQLFH
jgi:hypothetical protein